MLISRIMMYSKMVRESKQDLITQEINYQSSQGERIDWTIGTFGFYKDLANDYLATFGYGTSLACSHWIWIKHRTTITPLLGELPDTGKLP